MKYRNVSLYRKAFLGQTKTENLVKIKNEGLQIKYFTNYTSYVVNK